MRREPNLISALCKVEAQVPQLFRLEGTPREGPERGGPWVPSQQGTNRPVVGAGSENPGSLRVLIRAKSARTRARAAQPNPLSFRNVSFRRHKQDTPPPTRRWGHIL